MKKIHYVYVTTNLLNGMQYVGDHSCDDLEKDNYLGSGIYFRNAIKRIKTQEELEKLSKSLIGKKFTLEHRMNLSKSIIKNESQKGNKNSMYGKTHTEDSKNKNSIAHLGKKMSNEAKHNMSLSRLGKKRGKYKTKNILS